MNESDKILFKILGITIHGLAADLEAILDGGISDPQIVNRAHGTLATAKAIIKAGQMDLD